MTKHSLEWISAGFAFVAAIAWILSALQRLPDVPTKDFMGTSNVGIPALVRKLRIQSTWSALAAIAAALAAIAQGSSLLISN
jgi:hypothetical protein